MKLSVEIMFERAGCEITRLEGIGSRGAELLLGRSAVCFRCPSVTVSPLGSPSDRARNGHDVWWHPAADRRCSNALDLVI